MTMHIGDEWRIEPMRATTLGWHICVIKSASCNDKGRRDEVAMREERCEEKNVDVCVCVCVCVCV